LGHSFRETPGDVGGDDPEAGLRRVGEDDGDDVLPAGEFWKPAGKEARRGVAGTEEDAIRLRYGLEEEVSILRQEIRVLECDVSFAFICQFYNGVEVWARDQGQLHLSGERTASLAGMPQTV